MEVFSLEEDEGNAKFITQESKKSVDFGDMDEESDNKLFLNIGVNDSGFACQCVVLRVKLTVRQYSDFSDDDLVKDDNRRKVLLS